MVLRIYQEVVDHLNRFRMLDVDMLLLANRLHKVLMDNLSDLSPCFAIVHNEKVISLSDQFGHYGNWPVTEDVAFLIK